MSAAAGAAPVAFDVATLESEGISASVADFFSDAPRFAPGTSYVALYVNGVRIGTTTATFNARGELCLDDALLSKAGIAWPGGPAPKGCLDLHQAWPQATLTLRPGMGRVELLVPPQALSAEGPAPVYITGGNAAMLNYQLFNTRSTGPYGSDGTYYAQLEAGLNMGDWVLRTRDSYTRQASRAQWQHQEAYLQRTVLPMKSTVQVGQLNLNSPLFSAPAFNGAQLYPEGALAPAQGGTSFSGIAQTPAHVEVRQGGTLIYATLVPAGPFTLSRLPLLNSSTDLQVTIIESTGERRNVVVPATSFASNFAATRSGMSFAVGKPRSISGGDTDALDSQWFMTASGNFPVGHTTLTTGLMVADHYRALGAGMEGAPVAGTSAYLRSTLSQDQRVSTRGARVESGISATLTDAWSANASVLQQTVGYRDLTDLPIRADTGYRDVMDPHDWTPFVWDRARLQFSTSASYYNAWLGGINLGYSQTQLFSGGTSHSVQAGWSRTFGHVNVALMGELTNGEYAERRIYVSVSMPLGKAHVGATLINDGSTTQAALNLSQQINPYANYSVTATTQAPNAQQSYTGSLALRSKYTEIDLSAASYGSGTRSYSAQVSGGMVFDGGEPLFSPYPINDTYAVVSAGNIANARIDTPSGTVYTDYAGRAVAGSITPYMDSRFVLQARGLAHNVDVKNGLQVVQAGRGSVSHIDFRAVRLRPLLLHVTDAQGKPMESGVGVLDAKGNNLTLVDFDSQIFVDAGQLKAGIYIKPPHGPTCRLDAKLGEPDEDALYEQAQAVCRPVDSIPASLS